MKELNRFSPRREIALGVGAYLGYLAVRRMVWNDRGLARAAANARRVADFEHKLHVDIEPRVQQAALKVPFVVPLLNTAYAAGNVAMSVGWLITLFHRRDPAFTRERRAALIAFAGALPVFASFPTKPPRTLDGFVDTMAGERLGLDHPLLVRFYNPIAAMPSHHVAFAVVTGIGLAGRTTRKGRRFLWATYPGVVALVVISTANHFVADVAAGAALGAFARRITR